MRNNNTKHKKIWKIILNILLLLIWTCAVVIIAQLFVGYLMLWILGKEALAQPVPTAVYSAMSYVLALVVLLFVTPKIVSLKKDKKKQNPESMKLERNDLGLRGLPTWTDIGLAPVGYFVSILLAAGLVAIFNFFPWFDSEQIQDVGFDTYIIGFDRIIAFFILVVVAPIAEELIFRGWLYGKLRSMISKETSEKVSVVVSTLLVSLLFGAIHLQWNVGITVFAMSIVLCAMREITGTIYSGILMHMIRNGIAFYLLYVIGIV